MNKEFLSRLFKAASDQTPYYIEGLNLNELYVQYEDAQKGIENLFERVAEYAPSEEHDAVCEEVCAVCEAHERQGFVNGFQMGMLLLREIGVTPDKEVRP